MNTLYRKSDSVEMEVTIDSLMKKTEQLESVETNSNESKSIPFSIHPKQVSLVKKVQAFAKAIFQVILFLAAVCTAAFLVGALVVVAEVYPIVALGGVMGVPIIYLIYSLYLENIEKEQEKLELGRQKV
jgi:hypothetical protein